MSNEQNAYLTANGIEHQTSMPDSPQQNGRVERFQQTIVNGAEAMWHHAGLSTIKHQKNSGPVKNPTSHTLESLDV